MTSHLSGLCRMAVGVFLYGLAACSGHAVDLDAAPDAAPHAGPGVESVQTDSSGGPFWVDETRVYWQGALGSLQSCEFEDCSSTRISYGTDYSGLLVLGTDDLFFAGGPTSNTALFRCPKTGCAGAPHLFLRDEAQIQFAVVDSEYLYWSSLFDIYRCPLSGCGDLPEIVVENQVADGPLRLLGDSLYWSSPSYDPSTSQQSPEQILRAPKDGSSPPTTLVAASLQAVNYFNVVGDKIYFLDSQSRVRSCPVTGCGTTPPLTLVETDTSKSPLWVDDSGLYWQEPSASGLGTIRYCPLAGCANAEPQTLTSGSTWSFALNSRSYFWYETDVVGFDSRLYRKAKPAP